MIFFISCEGGFDIVPNALLVNELFQSFSALPQFTRITFQDFAGNVRRIERTANPCFHRIVGRFSLALSVGQLISIAAHLAEFLYFQPVALSVQHAA